ncbi:MAG: hypothetical protein KF894_14075 [Labilithrix sp.]|nr:hypothetical protein [Labilithrix sp.]
MSCERAWRRLATLATLTTLGGVGCTGQSYYGTPRTTPRGTFHAVIAPEMRGRLAPRQANSAEEEDPLVPGLGLQTAFRYGVHDRVDVGFHTYAFGVVGGDMKWNFLRSAHVDLGLSPRLSFALGSTRARERREADVAAGGMFGHMPAMLGINLGPTTLVVSPGGALHVDTYGRATVGWRAGVGVQIRLTKRFALQPEATYMNDLAGPANMEVATAGLGLLIDGLPSYGAP